MKTMLDEVTRKSAAEITALKKETDCLVVEKAQLVSSRGEVEEAVDVACQHIHESTTKLDAAAKAKRLGEVIMELQIDNSLLNALVYLDTPPE